MQKIGWLVLAEDGMPSNFITILKLLELKDIKIILGNIIITWKFYLFKQFFNRSKVNLAKRF